MKQYVPPPSKLAGNELKTFVQEDFVDKLTVDKLMILEAATGFGKTRTGLMALERLRSRLRDLVIVPTITLKEQWENQVNLNHTKVIVINGFVFNAGEEVEEYGTVFVDESHRVLNEASEWFSTALDVFKSKFLVMASATLSPKHKAFLNLKRPNMTLYRVSLSWCLQHKLVPPHVNYNVPVDFTMIEKSQMIEIQTKYNKYAKWFATYDLFDPFVDYSVFNDKTDALNNMLPNRIVKDSGMTKGQLIGMLNKWRAATNARKMMYHHAASKLVLAEEWMYKVETERPQKMLIFGKGIDMIEQLSELNSNAICFHSKHSDKKKQDIFHKFLTGEKPFLSSINTIIEGFDMEAYAEALGINADSTTVQIALRLAYDSSDLKTTQTIGRILRYNEDNPDQVVVFVSAYVRDFTVRNKVYSSQEKVWLINSQKQQLNVRWVNDISEITL